MAVCIVTGVAGFVGSHLAEKLLDLGYAVVGIDNLSTGYLENMDTFIDHEHFSFYEADINDNALVGDILQMYSSGAYFFHLAAIVSVPFSVAHPEMTEKTNYLATIELLEKCKVASTISFVQAGSAAEYGEETRLPIKEEYATENTEHVSPYGRTKYLASLAVSQSENPRGTTLRFFNIYGPRQDPSSQYSGVISRFIESALKGEKLTIFGDGKQTRDFIYIDDVLEAYLLAAGIDPKTGKRGRPHRGIYNIACSRETSINCLAEIIKNQIDPRLPVVHLDPRSGDIRHSLADIERAKRILQWRPKWGMEEGLRKTISWYA